MKKNRAKTKVELNDRFYEEVEVEARRRNIPVTDLLNNIFANYFFPPANWKDEL